MSAVSDGRRASGNLPGGPVGLASDDLMIRSRLAAVFGPLGFELRSVTGPEQAGALGLLLVDLNRKSEDRLALVAAAVRVRPDLEVICFGPHTEMAELHQRATAAGASRCVANSHIIVLLAGRVGSVGQVAEERID